MVKRHIMLILCGLLALGSAAAQAAQPVAGNATAIPATGCLITLPDGWQTATQPDLHRAVVESVSPDTGFSIRIFVSSQPDWTLDDWQTALIKSSQQNSVTDIGGLAVMDRQWLAYHLTLDRTRVFAAATDIGGGLFVTLEFQAQGDGWPEDAYPKGAIDACLGSLQPAP